MNLSTSWQILFSLGYIFIVTFIVFPGVFFNSYWSFLDNKTQRGWYNISIITIFNVCDTIGRKLGGKYMISSGKVIAGSLLRTVFVFTTIMIVIYDSEPTYFFEQDWFKIINLILFALSNGYISTQLCIWAPQFVKEDQREQVGFLNGTFIGSGILMGSIITIPIGSALSSHWL